MKTKILTVIAILLAIPTYGISLVVWLFAKYKYDKFSATRVLINAAVISYNNGGANLPIVFDYFGGKIINDMGNSVSGILQNPSNGDLMIV